MCFKCLKCFKNRGLCFIGKKQLIFYKTFLNVLLRGVTRNTKKKKSPKAIKQELLAWIIETVDEDYSELNQKVKNAKEPTKRGYIYN